MSMPHRRRFLSALGAGALAMRAPRLYAAPRGSARLLVVFLRGAYDCNHVLVPHSSEFYYEARPNIAIAAPDPSSPSAAIRLDADWALAPALRTSLLPLWERQQLAFVPFAGISDDLSRSHFATQDHIEAGWPVASRRHDSGFLARLATQLNGVEPIAFTRDQPAIYRGAQVPNLSLKGNDLRASGFDARQSALLAELYVGTPQQAAVEEGIALREQALRDTRGEEDASSRGAASASTFEQEARRVARMMRENYRLGFVDVGGWDTHVNQGDGEGALARKLSSLGQGLAGYADELGKAEWRNTVVVVLSEFGRTFRENGNKGTDHGHGTVYWLLGGGVRGGRILGEQVVVEQRTLFQNRDYPVLTGYQDLLATLFQQVWGMSGRQINRSVFAASTPLRIQLV